MKEAASRRCLPASARSYAAALLASRVLRTAQRRDFDRPVIIGLGHEMKAYGHLPARRSSRRGGTSCAVPLSEIAVGPVASGGMRGQQLGFKEERLVLAVLAGVGSLRIAAKALPFG